MAEQEKILVLLSSYSGERFIEAQIQSILDQRGVDVTLLVRDDGSTDRTPEILRRLDREHGNMEVTFGANLGVIDSFFQLLGMAGSGFDYYALSDQDDVWNLDKLARAVALLKPAGSHDPLCYCSAVEYVDEELGWLGNSPAYPAHRVGFSNALVQNVATGCTMVFNAPALLCVAEAVPARCIMHDWWIYLVISAFGRIIYDPVPSMKYRQHAGNVLGISKSYWARSKRRLKRMVGANTVLPSDQLRQFCELFGDRLPPHRLNAAQELANYRQGPMARLKALCSTEFHRQSLLDGMLIRLMILAGRF